jgi:hypothetical protein
MMIWRNEMHRRIIVSEESYQILRSHIHEYGETYSEAVDELIQVRDAAWASTLLNPGLGKKYKEDKDD